MSDKSDEKLGGLFREIGELEAVPLETATSMERTIQGLLQDEKSVKTTWIRRNSLALAASFVAVFGIGVALNMDANPIKNISPATSTNQNQQNNNDVLTSSESEIEITEASIRQFNSGLDYAKPIVIQDLPFIPISSYSKVDTLSEELNICLSELGLSQTTSFIDKALYNGIGIKAVWSALDLKSWQISIINNKCEPLDEIFVRDN